MTHLKVRLIVFSAVMLVAAYAIPSWCDWLVFFFLVPLFYAAPISWRYGLLWGALFFGFHLYGVWQLILEKGEGDIRFVVIGILFVYCTAQAAFWFWITSKGALLFNILAYQLIWSGCIWYCYFIWTYTSMFWFWGGWFGYCFALPLLPLAEH